MRIIMFLTNPFTTDARVYYEATSLIQAGHQVTVVAYDSEKKYPPSENIDDIEIIRVPAISTWRGIAGVISKGVSLLLWQLKCRRLALHLHRQNRFDAVHCHDLDTLPIGVALKRRLGLHLVYDAHEIYGYMLARDLPFWIASRFLWLEKRLLCFVNHVISVDEAQKRYLDLVEALKEAMVVKERREDRKRSLKERLDYHADIVKIDITEKIRNLYDRLNEVIIRGSLRCKDFRRKCDIQRITLR